MLGSNSNLSMIAKCMKSWRVSAGLSQRDVSDALGYSTPQFISNWERGVSNPPISALKTLAKLYKVDAEFMFGILKDSEVAQLVSELDLNWT